MIVNTANTARHLIYLGPDKAASTWLHRMLGRMSFVSTHPSKELFFFDDDKTFSRGFDWYTSQFDQSRPVTVDVCHDYLFGGIRVANRIGDYSDGVADLLVGARPPIQRAVSAYRFMQFQGRISNKTTFAQALHETPELIDHGLIGKHIASFRQLGIPITLLRSWNLEEDLRTVLGKLPNHSPMWELEIEAVLSESLVVNPAKHVKFPLLVAAGRNLLHAGRQLGLHTATASIKQIGERLVQGQPPELLDDEEIRIAVESFESELMNDTRLLRSMGYQRVAERFETEFNAKIRV